MAAPKVEAVKLQKKKTKNYSFNEHYKRLNDSIKIRKFISIKDAFNSVSYLLVRVY